MDRADPPDNSRNNPDGEGVKRHASDLARDLMGRECETQPGSHQLPVLEAAAMDTGCRLKDFSAAENNLDVLQLYKEIRPSTVHFQLSKDGQVLGGGTGVMVKKDGESCKILTDNHVVSDEMRSKYGIDDIKVVTEDGTRYDTKIYRANPAKDLAVVSIATGANTDAICKAVEIQDESTTSVLAKGDRVVSIGQPYGTGAIYTAEGEADQTISRGDAVRRLGAARLPAGDDPARHLDILKQRTTLGFSGAGVFRLSGGDQSLYSKSPYNQSYKMVGVIDMANDRGISLMTPVNAAEIKALTD